MRVDPVPHGTYGLMQIDMCKDGIVEQIAQPGLEVAVQVSILEDALGLLAADVEMAL
jgi:hypothetical protein